MPILPRFCRKKSNPAQGSTRRNSPLPPGGRGLKRVQQSQPVISISEITVQTNTYAIIPTIMITKFGVLYAGCVDMGDIGYAGTPANERWLPDEQLATVFDKSASFAKTMDKLGFDTIWGAEHHFQREGYECIPNLLMLFVHLAHLTENLRFGCGFNINPMWHPVRLAEDYATADILTDGRVRFGIGRGYHSREVEVFGNPIIDQDANRELFEEQVEVMYKAFNQASFSHHGKHYDIPPAVPYRGYELEEITLVPRPKNPVEWWQPVVSASERGLNFMAKYGIKGVIGGGAAPGGASDQVVYQVARGSSRTRTRTRTRRRPHHLVLRLHRRLHRTSHRRIPTLGRGTRQDVWTLSASSVTSPTNKWLRSTPTTAIS